MLWSPLSLAYTGKPATGPTRYPTNRRLQLDFELQPTDPPPGDPLLAGTQSQNAVLLVVQRSLRTFQLAGVVSGNNPGHLNNLARRTTTARIRAHIRIPAHPLCPVAPVSHPLPCPTLLLAYAPYRGTQAPSEGCPPMVCGMRAFFLLNHAQGSNHRRARCRGWPPTSPGPARPPTQHPPHLDQVACAPCPVPHVLCPMSCAMQLRFAARGDAIRMI